MKKRYLILSLLISYMGIFIFTSPIFAVEDADELYPTIGKEVEAAPAPLEEIADRFKVSFSASVIGGYDTNAKLEHYDPVSSVFIQETFGVEGKYLLSDSLTLRGEYDLSSINYFRDSEWNLLDNVIKAGLDIKITDSLLWSVDYIADFVRFPQDNAEEYTINAVETGLRHDMTDRLYHKIIYRFSYKDYSKWKTRNRIGTIQLDDREDRRNVLEHQLGFYPTDRTFIRADNTIYFNDSNEVYLDYYNYTVVKTKGTVIHLITDKLYGSANIGYQFKAFENRNKSDGDDNQRNHLLMYGTSLFYDITPNLSIGANFDYRKNFSNEGNRKYTNYIISGGVYTRF